MGLLLGAGCTATGTVGPVVPSTAATPTASAAAAAFTSIQQYWDQAYPAAFGAAWPGLRSGLQPVDSDLSGGPQLCMQSPAQLAGNAFYCPNQDGIVYDTAVLVPVLLGHYGRAALLTSLAHEFGHAVAARAGVAKGPPVWRELQADCFAGTVVAGQLPSTEVVSALAPLLDFADGPTVQPDDPTAHGTAVDRAQAFQLGYRHGPTACRDISTADLDLVSGTTTAPGPKPESSAPTPGAVTPADAALANLIGPFAGTVAAAAAAPGRSGLGATALGCALGDLTSTASSRPADPDQALNFLRSRPGADTDLVFGFLDGFAGRC